MIGVNEAAKIKGVSDARMRQQADMVDVVAHVRPIINIKG